MGIFSAIGTTFRAVVFTTRVAAGVVTATARGAAASLNTAAQVVDKVSKKDWDGLENLVGNKAQALENSLVARGNALEKLFEEAGQSYKNPRKRFFTKENAARAASVAAIGAGVIAGGSILDQDLDADDASAGDLDASDLSSAGFLVNDLAIDNGIFVGGEDELPRLIEYGEIEGAEHIPSEEIERNLSVRNEFLSAHGFSEVPSGYEVHHVIPLSAGGEDSVSNMILVSEEEHAAITAAHAGFYGWHD